MAITHLRSTHTLTIICDSCHSPIANLTRVHCPECIIDLCVLCFSTSNHHHSYLVIEPLTLTLNDWPALEELLLCEGLQIHGIGNWQDISELVGRSVAEIEAHFHDIYKIGNKYKKAPEIPSQSSPLFHEIASYMPKRMDFDTEYENDIETIFREVNEDPLLSELGDFYEALIDSFHNVQRVRANRKYHILEKNLIGMTKLQEKENNMCDYKLRILQRIKPLCQYLNKDDFNRFFNGLCYEEYLRQKMEEQNKNTKMNFFEHEKKRSVLMSDKEKEICVALRLSYNEYMKIKDAMVVESIKSGLVDTKRMTALLGCNDDKLGVLVEFFQRNEWIQ